MALGCSFAVATKAMQLHISAAPLLRQFRIVWIVTKLQQGGAARAAGQSSSLQQIEARPVLSDLSDCRSVEQRLALFRYLRSGAN
jgi:hypothetical protein